jgi:hypothetical protein
VQANAGGVACVSPSSQVGETRPLSSLSKFHEAHKQPIQLALDQECADQLTGVDAQD